MFCPNCAKPVDDNDAFCRACAHPLRLAPLRPVIAVPEKKKEDKWLPVRVVLLVGAVVAGLTMSWRIAVGLLFLW
jgi:predicted amidophosphoribosyltransferase